MNEKFEKAQDVVLEKINHFCREFGLNNIMAQLYAVLYLSNKPVSLNDMVERLKISKGSVSINIRALENYGAVRRVWVKGSRRDYYEAELDLKKVIINKVKSGVQRRLNEISNMLNDFNKIINSAKAELSAEEKHLARLYQERIKKVEELKSLGNTALALAEKFL